MPHGFGTKAGIAGKLVGNVGNLAWQLTKGAVEFGSEGIRAGADVVRRSSDTFMDGIRTSQYNQGMNEAPKHPRGKHGNVRPASQVGDLSNAKFNDIRGKHSSTLRFKKESISQLKGFGVGTGISMGMYGLMAYASDPGDAVDAGDRMNHYAKNAVGLAADIASDAVLTGIGTVAALTLGPAGAVIAGGITAFNIAGGFLGIDAGTQAMKFMDYADQEYDNRKNGPKFNMTQNSSMAMQRQIQNLHGSGSNMAEQMHNFKDDRNLDDYLQNNEFNKSKNLCGTNYKKCRRKMAATFEI